MTFAYVFKYILIGDVGKCLNLHKFDKQYFRGRKILFIVKIYK